MQQIQQLSVPGTIFPVDHNQPMRLTIEEIEDPQLVLQDFFKEYCLIEIRADLKNMLLDALRAEEANSVRTARKAN